MWKTGHSFIKARLRETGAELAGEMSGHVFFNDHWYGFDDGLYTAVRLLHILANDGRNATEIFADLPDTSKHTRIRSEHGRGRTLQTHR